MKMKEKWQGQLDSLFCGKATAVKTIHRIVFKSRLSNPVNEYLAGTAGFEPANVGVKGRCLTAWRRPCIRRVKKPVPKHNALR